jgi:hypothetical protein
MVSVHMGELTCFAKKMNRGNGTKVKFCLLSLTILERTFVAGCQ